ncbi:hypothetical protein F4827_001703 [Paraburkholderia bannensis]|uniref:Uncharacterized protein n=1 Tax=Paraburkholderia bannensis TaxID=765414 RepID=A0A7W9TWV2_9BURK|nr:MULTISPECIES: hypothetical protein [Paraburkholderia]MBB3256858.1 hypothetical protein [Paraburkholderia sp. WP4_3_2]MBB6101855.1 hypothetical protein [Paraburkholderia bannensis]
MSNLKGLGAVLSIGIANIAHAAVTYSYTNVPVAVICPTPGLTAYLESDQSPPHFSAEWKHEAGVAHCRSVKSDRPLIVTKIGETTFRGHVYPMAEIFPAGVVISADGFGGPYYISSTRIKTAPSAAQVRANLKSLNPTVVHYLTGGIDSPIGSSAPSQ